jgi:regulator of sigma E protease
MFEIIVFVLVLSFLVLIHELGHYLLARKNKIKIQEFGLGYPPRILKLFTYRGTIFSLNLIPFGGFVQLEGENGPEEKGLLPLIKGNQEKKWGPFFSKSVSARLQTLLAGAIFNFLFGILAFALIFSKTGIPRELGQQARIHDFTDNSPAINVGMEKNTNIVAFYSENDQQWVKVNTIAEVQEYVSSHLGEEVSIRTTKPCEELTCPDEYQEYQIYLRQENERTDLEGAMGVVFTTVIYEHYPWYLAPIQGIIYGFREALLLGLLILQALGVLIIDLVRGQSVAMDVAGPVGIVHQAQTYGFFDGGWLNILSFAALLSINLGVMNLLPIPALDGGRAIFVLLEKITAKEKIEKIANWANYIGFFVLIFLMIFVSINDVVKLFN